MSVIISTSASPAAFTISNTKPDGSVAFPVFILLIDSRTMSLSISTKNEVFHQRYLQ